ncbi:FtsH protease activity modulator HflK [Frateuria aurantia]
MAWNEPGKGSRDPWSKPPSRPPSSGGGNGLEALLRRLKALLGKLPRRSGGLLGLLLAVVVSWLLVSSHIRVDNGQTAVVLRLGHYDRTLGPGFHLRLPRPFETVVRVNLAELRAESGAVQALTTDRGLVEVRFTMQYQVSDARQYLFAAVSPETVLSDALDAQLRAMVGSHSLDQVLGARGTDLAPELRAKIQSVVDRTPVGLQLMAVDIQSVEPPEAVHDAYAAISSARDEAQAAQDQARTYAGKVAAAARLDAQHLLQAAAADQAASIAHAQSDVAGFTALLPAYRQNPGLTRHTLWLAATGQVLAANAKVVDSSGQTVIHLSIAGRSASAAPAAASSSAAPAPEVSASPDAKDKQP